MGATTVGGLSFRETLIRRLRAIEERFKQPLHGFDAQKLTRSLDEIERALALVDAPMPDIGYDGKQPVMREPKNRSPGELRAGIIGLENVNTDELERLANTYDDGSCETLTYLRARKNKHEQPLINDLQLRAGRRLYKDWFLSQLGRSGSAFEIRVSGGGAHNREPDMALDAKSRVNDAMRYVGQENAQILVEVVIDDMSLRDIAVKRGWRKQETKFVVPLVRASLDALIRNYELEDSKS